MPRDELADLLWGDALPATWEKALTVLVSKLRTVLSEAGVDGVTALTAAFGCYRLELPQGSSVDVLEAESAVREAESFLAANEPLKAADVAARAESVVRRPFLPGDDGPWVESKRRELGKVRARALRVLAEASLAADKPADAVRWAEQATEAEPFRESGYRLLMTAHVAAGNRAEALRVYDRCRRLLADELGTYPSPETDSMYRGLLETPATQEPSTGDASSGLGEAPPRWSRRKRNAVALFAGVVVGIAAALFALTGSGSAAKLLPDSVIRIDPKTLKATEVAQVGDAPDLIVPSGGYLWIANNILRDSNSSGISATGHHTLIRVEPSTGTTEPVGGVEPCGLAADPSGDVWVANCFTKDSGQPTNVVRVNATTLEFTKTILVPGGNFYYRGIAYGGGSLWLSNPSTSGLTQVDPQTKVEKTLHVSACCALAWSEGYGDLWMTDFQGHSLARVHSATGTVQPIPGAGVNPAAVALDGNVVWVADWGHPQVLRLSATGSGHPQAVRLRIPRRTGCPHLSCVWTVGTGAGYVWAAVPRDRAVWRIDPRTNRVTRISLPYRPAGVAVDDDNVWVTVRKG